MCMTMSLDQFREALKRADMRGPLGLQLSDVEAQQVADDPASSQGWYAYWLSLQPTAAQQTPPPPAAPSVSPDPTAGPPAAAPGFDAAPPPFSPGPQHAQTPASPYPGAPTAPYPGAPTSSYPGAPAPDAQPTAAYAPTAVTAGGDPGSPSFATAQYAGMPSDGAPAKKRNVGLWVTLSILGALLLIIAIVVVTAFTTARHWTKVDVPEQPETFHSEEYETGRYDVSMDTVDPCYVNQDWTDCTNLLQASYDANCAGVELTETATAICADYSNAISQMRAQDSEGAYVATLGTYGNLTRTPEIDTRQVSNDDYRPAETHEAVCYLGFLGECE